MRPRGQPVNGTRPDAAEVKQRLQGPLARLDLILVDRQELLAALVCLLYLGRLGGKRCGGCPPCLLAAQVGRSADESAYWQKITREADERNAGGKLEP